MKGEKQMMRLILSLFAILCAFAGNAFAAVDLTGVTLDTSTPETLAATILVGLGVIWGIRKVVKLINRS